MIQEMSLRFEVFYEEKTVWIWKSKWLLYIVYVCPQ